MEQQLNTLLDSAKSAIVRSSDLAELEQLRVKYLGKKGELTRLLKGVGKLSAEEKPRIGKLVNTIKSAFQAALTAQEQQLKVALLQEKLLAEKIDISLDGRFAAVGGLHPVTLVQQRVIEIFTQMGFHLAEGPEIEDEYHNFTALNFPPHHPARAMQDTFYVEGNKLLRTHTSTVQIRSIKEYGVPIRLITLGRVYRCDSDQTHTPMFHQLEGLVVAEHCSMAELKGVLQDFLNSFFATDLKMRLRPSYFPFTEPSAEVDIYQDSTQSWMEILGCGMVHPNVLRNLEVDSQRYSGFAFGVGLDRLAMLRYQIPDLRLLFENDLRFLQQF